jgi:hypothetical protein
MIATDFPTSPIKECILFKYSPDFDIPSTSYILKIRVIIWDQKTPDGGIIVTKNLYEGWVPGVWKFFRPQPSPKEVHDNHEVF